MWACLCFLSPAFSACFPTKHLLSTFCLLTAYQFWNRSQQLCLWLTAFLPLYLFILQQYWSLLVCFPSLGLSFIFLTIWSVSATFLINSSLSSSTSLMLFSSVSAYSLLCQLSFHFVIIFSFPGFLICLLFIFICSCFILACLTSQFLVCCADWALSWPKFLALPSSICLHCTCSFSLQRGWVCFLLLPTSVTDLGPERAVDVSYCLHPLACSCAVALRVWAAQPVGAWETHGAKLNHWSPQLRIHPYVWVAADLNRTHGSPRPMRKCTLIFCATKILHVFVANHISGED